MQARAKDSAAGTPRLRQAVAADRATVKAVVDETFFALHDGTVHPSPRPTTVDFAPLIEKGWVWMIERCASGASSDAAEPIGALVLGFYPDHLYIDILAIRPIEQNCGYGSLAVRHAVAQAETAGLPEIRLYTNPGLERNLIFYRKLGFDEVGRRAHPRRPDETLVDMVKRVGKSGSVPETALDPHPARAT